MTTYRTAWLSLLLALAPCSMAVGQNGAPETSIESSNGCCNAELFLDTDASVSDVVSDEAHVFLT